MIKTTSPSSVSGPSEETLPRIVGDWELLRPIGAGQMSRVYQARPAQGGGAAAACYALKLLREEHQHDDRLTALVRREAEVGRLVSNAHLISILAAHVHEPPYSVVMPLLSGRTLAEQLQRRRKLAVGETLWIARQTAEAMAALDAAGWRHADIKPSNIFIAPHGHVTLLDLGFGQRIHAGGGAFDRPILGTPLYLAPEAFLSSYRVDVRSDIYSLGVTLFQMLSGRTPFESEDPAELIELHLRQPPSELRTQHPRLSTQIASLIWRMLSKNPQRRPQTPRELVRELIALELDTLPDRLAA